MRVHAGIEAMGVVPRTRSPRRSGSPPTARTPSGRRAGAPGRTEVGADRAAFGLGLQDPAVDVGTGEERDREPDEHAQDELERQEPKEQQHQQDLAAQVEILLII